MYSCCKLKANYLDKEVHLRAFTKKGRKPKLGLQCRANKSSSDEWEYHRPFHTPPIRTMLATSSPWLQETVSELVKSIPLMSDEFIRVTKRGISRVEDKTEKMEERSSMNHKSTSSTSSTFSGSFNGGSSTSRRRMSSCASTSNSYIYSMSDIDVDTREIWDDDDVLSVAYMKRLTVENESTNTGHNVDQSDSSTKAVWGLSVSMKGRDKFEETASKTESGTYIVTTTSAACSFVGKGDECHMCTRFTLTPACKKVSGFEHANDVVEVSWLQDC